MEKRTTLGSITGKEVLAYMSRGKGAFDADRDELVKDIRTLAARMADLVNEKPEAAAFMHLCVTVTATVDLGDGPDPFLTVRFGPGADDNGEPFCKQVKDLMDAMAAKEG